MQVKKKNCKAYHKWSSSHHLDEGNHKNKYTKNNNVIKFELDAVINQRLRVCSLFCFSSSKEGLKVLKMKTDCPEMFLVT